jgi:hypothetical protein
MWPFSKIRNLQSELELLQTTVVERDACIARLLAILHDWEERYPLRCDSLIDDPHTGIR